MEALAGGMVALLAAHRDLLLEMSAILPPAVGPVFLARVRQLLPAEGGAGVASVPARRQVDLLGNPLSKKSRVALGTSRSVVVDRIQPPEPPGTYPTLSSAAFKFEYIMRLSA